jgi:methyl-accepting chemotaxis protein
MKSLDNLKVGLKLTGGFLIIALVLAVVTAIGYLNLGTLSAELSEMYTSSALPIAYMDKFEAGMLKLRGNLYKYVAIPEERTETEQDIATQIDSATKALSLLETTSLHQDDRADVPDLKNKWDVYQKETANLISLVKAGDDQAALASMKSGGAASEARSALQALVDKIVKRNSEEADQAALQGQQLANQAVAMMIGAGLVGVLLAIGLGIVLSRSITRPLALTVHMIQEMGLGHLGTRLRMTRQDEIGVMAQTMDQFADDLQTNVVGTMKKIASGDLSAEVKIKDNQDEIGPALKQTIESLSGLIAETGMLTKAASDGHLIVRGDANKFKGGYRDIVQGINSNLDLMVAPLKLIAEAANSLTSAAAEILAATTQQASGASEQSAAISQTTTTVDEVKTIAEQASIRVQEVANSSQRALEVSRAGQRAVQDTIESMEQIKERVEGIAENILALSEQTQQIGEIIATVNDIASQSNILALNASVEAARAGEHGKGFAVVAVEVRNLAEQSKQATAQVKAILSEIQKATNTTVMATEEGTKGVDKGVQLTAQAREAIEQLAGVINESAQAATQVVAGGRQQVTGVEQIALAMSNINQATVQSLASTRQAEKSAQNLNELARNLTQTVAQYKL